MRRGNGIYFQGKYNFTLQVPNACITNGPVSSAPHGSARPRGSSPPVDTVPRGLHLHAKSKVERDCGPQDHAQ